MVRRRQRAHDPQVGAGPGRRLLADPRDVDGEAMPPEPGSPRSSAGRCSRSTTGTPTLPVASPQIFGDQTDVPESGDWWDAGYLMMWGSNVPVTRTPDAHWMAEARYRGQKVVVVAPDYADNVKFADEWLAAAPGTDGALAMAMGHVVLKEFFVDKGTPYFDGYVRQYTDLPYLVVLDLPEGRTRHPKARQVPDRLRPCGQANRRRTPSSSPSLIDGRTGEAVVPNGSLGDRFGEEGEGRWNLDSATSSRPLDNARRRRAPTSRRFPASTTSTATDRAPQGAGGPIGDHLVTTVFELMLAQYGVGRRGLPGTGPRGTTTRVRPTHPPGRRRSPESPRRPSPGSPASSPRTPRTPRAVG